MRKYFGLRLAALVFGLACLGLFALPVHKAAAANPTTMNFQGKVVNSDGTNVSNGTYSFIFRIYNTASPTTTTSCTSTATCLWEETQGSVTVANGVFQVQLGSACALTSASCNNTASGGIPANWSASSLYLTMQFNGDSAGFMSPTIQLTSVPFAFNADNLGGLAAPNFVQLAQGVQNDASTTNASIAINKTGATAGILDLQRGGIDLVTISNTGNTLFKPYTASDSPTFFQIQSAGAANTLLTADTSNNKVVIGDGSGTNTNTTQFVVDSATVDPSSGSNGSIYYNTSEDKFRCYQGGAWADCLGATSNSTLSLVSGLINVAANTAGQVAESLIWTTATAVSNTAGATGFVAPAGGSFRTCLVKNNAAVTAGTVGLRWRVNGVSVGSAACVMNSTTNTRSSSTALDAGVVTFSAGDTIGIAFDGGVGYTPTSDDYTVYWTLEYNSTLTNAGATLQSAYNNYNVLSTTDAHDVVINATDTATDANVLINLQCATSCGSNGRFAVQNGGTDVFSIAPNGGSAIINNNTATGFAVQDSSSSKSILSVNSSTDQLLLGQASGLNGALVFNNSAGSGTATITLAGNPSSNYVYQLPTGTVGSSQCLQSGTVSGTNVPLVFGSCGSSGGTLASTYNSASSTGNTITYTTAGAGIVVQDASTPLTGNLLTFQNNAASFNYLTLNLASGTPHLKIYGASSSDYADIYYSGGQAYFGASSGTTNVGSGSGPIGITAGSGAAVTIAGHAASSFSTDAGNLTLQDTAASSSLILDAGTAGNGTVTVGNTDASTISIGSNSASHTITIGSTTGGSTSIFAGSGNVGINASASNAVLVGTANNETVTVGATSNTHTLTFGQSTAGETLNIGNGNVATGLTNTINIGATATSTGKDVITIGSLVAASSTTIQGGTGDITLNTAAGNTVQIGSGTTDANVTFLQLDSDSDFSTDEGTCNTTTNQGALYYNTNTNEVRACINSAWQDVASTEDLAQLLFGVVPNSGPTPGDLIGASGNANSPCKVFWVNATHYGVAACNAYSGGRKVAVAAIATTTFTLAANDYANLCLNSSGVPTLSSVNAADGGGGILNNLTSTNATTLGQPLLCLATIHASGTANNLAMIYDTRTFTTTTKSYAAINSTTQILGGLVQQSTTSGLVSADASATATNTLGVIVAGTGAASSTSPNVLIATAGPQWIKSVTTTTIPTSATDNTHTLIPSTTAGYVNSGTTLATSHADIGVAMNVVSATCTTNTTFATSSCQGSEFTILNIGQ